MAHPGEIQWKWRGSCELSPRLWVSDYFILSRGWSWNDREDTNRQSVDHGLESHVDLTATDDLSDIGRVVRLQQGNLEAFILEVATRLSEVQRGVVRGGVPGKDLAIVFWQKKEKEQRKKKSYSMLLAYQLVRKVILSVAILTQQEL